MEAFACSLLSIESLNFLYSWASVKLDMIIFLVMVLGKSKMLFMNVQDSGTMWNRFRGIYVDIVNNTEGHSGCEKQLHRSVFAEL